MQVMELLLLFDDKYSSKSIHCCIYKISTYKIKIFMLQSYTECVIMHSIMSNLLFLIVYIYKPYNFMDIIYHEKNIYSSLEMVLIF